MDDVFPEQLDLKIEHTRDWPGAERLHMLLLEARNRLAAQAEELAELRAGQAAAVDEALRRQAAAVCKRVELSDPLGPELGAVLALVQDDLRLEVAPKLGCGHLWPDRGNHWAGWRQSTSDAYRAHGEGPTREAAILAATAKLLDLDEGSLQRRVAGSLAAVVKAAMAVVDDLVGDLGKARDLCTISEIELIDAVEQLRGATAEPRPRSCRSCVHFERDAPRAASGDGSARPCIAHDSLLAHPDGGAECEDYEPDTDPAPRLPGVEIDGNVVRSEGGDADRD
jgi:hypothetical protein